MGLGLVPRSAAGRAGLQRAGGSLSSPGWLLPRSLRAGGGCSARGQCPLPRIEKVTGNVSPPRGAGTGFSGAFPTEPSRSFGGGPQAQDAGAGGAWWGNDLYFHVLHCPIIFKGAIIVEITARLINRFISSQNEVAFKAVVCLILERVGRLDTHLSP